VGFESDNQYFDITHKIRPPKDTDKGKRASSKIVEGICIRKMEETCRKNAET
jgi:hypothetical protein